jgi:fucose permease
MAASSTREQIYAVGCASMFVFGLILSLPGTVLAQPDVVARFGLTLADRGALISALFFGLLAGCVVSGPVVHRFGHRTTLVASAMLVAVCLPILTVASHAMTAAAALAACGFASGGINTAGNALASDLFPDDRGRRMNGLGIAFGVGGLTMPAATAAGAALGSWRIVVLVNAAVALIVAVGSTRVPEPAHDQPSRIALRAWVRRPDFAWLCVLISLCGANEAAYAGWIGSYFTSSGAPAVAGTWLLATHWVGLIFGRALFAGRVDRVKRVAIQRGALGGAAVAAIFAAKFPPAAIPLAPFMAGVAIAAVMPTALALAGEHYPGSGGALFGVLLTIAQFGSMVLPALIGAVAEESGVAAGMSLLILNGLAIALVVERVGR